MSRGELDRIQNQLKVAVMSHQMLVTTMKTDSQNSDVEVQLHELQSQIRVLSEKQKLVVQQLREEILSMRRMEGESTGEGEEPQQNEDDQVDELISTTSSCESLPTDLSVKLCTQPPQEPSGVVRYTQPPQEPSGVVRYSPGCSSTNNYGVVKREAGVTQGCISGLLTDDTGDNLQHDQDCVRRDTATTTTLQYHEGGSGGGAMCTATTMNYDIASVTMVITGGEASSCSTSGRCTSAITPRTVGAGGGGGGAGLSILSSSMKSNESNSSCKPTLPHPPPHPHNHHQQQHHHRAPSHKMTLSWEERKKLEFMSCLGLVTPDSLRELQSKRTERKRKSTANPQFIYGHFEPETELIVREDCCTVCHRSGELLMCDVCSLVYHLQCLDPPLVTVPQGFWSCLKCQSLWKQQSSGKEDCSPATLALVYSFLTQKAAKEEEKKQIQKKVDDLLTEKHKLQEKSKLLSHAIMQQKLRRTELESTTSSAQDSVKKLRSFVEMFTSISFNS